MSIAEKLLELPAQRVVCRTCNWIKTLSDEDKTAIQYAIDDPNWSRETLLRVLREDGLNVSSSAFRHHVIQKH